jgi:hypothetical protein
MKTPKPKDPAPAEIEEEERTLLKTNHQPNV